MIFNDPSRMLQLIEFVWVVFNIFLLKEETGRSKISSNHNRWYFAVSLIPFSFLVNNHFKIKAKRPHSESKCHSSDEGLVEITYTVP